MYVLPRILESKKMAKSGRTKQKEADLEYSVAKQVEKMIRYRLKLHDSNCAIFLLHWRTLSQVVITLHIWWYISQSFYKQDEALLKKIKISIKISSSYVGSACYYSILIT